MKKRIVSAILAVLTLCSIMASTALAVEESAQRNYLVCPRCDKGQIYETSTSEMTDGPVLAQCPRGMYRNCERRTYTVTWYYNCNTCTYKTPTGRTQEEYRWTHINH